MTLENPNKLRLIYFPIQGLGERCRLTMVLNDVDFEDYHMSHDEWKEFKPKSKFGQLPMLEIDDGAIAIAQSVAIVRYVGRLGTKSAYPENDLALEVKIDECIALAEEMAKSWSPCLYVGMRPDAYGHAADSHKTDEGKERTKALREQFLEEKLPQMMQYVTDMVKETGGFLATKDEPTIADCCMVPFLNNFRRGYMDFVPTTSLDKYPEVVAYITRFMSHPKIAAWYDKQKK